MRRLVVMALLALSLTACAPFDASATSIPERGVSHAPAGGASKLRGAKVQSFPLPGFSVRLIAGLDHGFAFTGWKQGGAVEGLYYYAYTTQQVTTLDSANPSVIDGTQVHFSIMTGSGDRIVYLKSDDTYRYWEFDTITVGSKPTVILAPASATESMTTPFNGSFATDGSRIVWSRTLATSGGQVSQLSLYDPQTSLSSQIATSTQDYFNETIEGNTIVYMTRPFDSTNQATETFYRVTVTNGSPQQIATTQGAINFDLNDSALIWDNINTRTSYGLNLATGETFSQDKFTCMRPALSAHYLGCVDLGKHVYLYDLNTADSVALADNEAVASIVFSPDRALWWSDTQHQMYYVILPA